MAILMLKLRSSCTEVELSASRKKSSLSRQCANVLFLIMTENFIMPIVVTKYLLKFTGLLSWHRKDCIFYILAVGF